MMPHHHRYLPLLLLVVANGVSAAPFRTKPKAVIASKSSSFVLTDVITQSRFDRMVNKIFDDADSNKDGSISFAECYELVLNLYININRQAPIPPPSRRTVHQLFIKEDISRDQRLQREEFKKLARVLGSRAATRLAAHKVVTLIGAPLLAAYVVRRLTGKEWLPAFAAWVVPDSLEEKVLPVITSKNFCRTVLIVIFVSTLGNFIFRNINWILDKSLPKDELEERMFYK
jgi:hypothetical protein